MLSILYGKPDIKAAKNPHLYFRVVVLVNLYTKLLIYKVLACLDYLGYIS